MLGMLCAPVRVHMLHQFSKCCIEYCCVLFVCHLIACVVTLAIKQDSQEEGFQEHDAA